MSAAHVIGAGLSGLASAWHLVENGCAVTVFDRASGPGGLIQTLHTDHGLVETAANAFVRDDVVDGWFTRLGIEPLTPTPHSRRRYIFRDGKPRRWPLRVGETATLAMRFGAAGITRGLRARGTESMAEWGTRVAGPAATEWLLEPAMQGIYATRASELSAAAIFGGRKRGRRAMVSPPNGMGQFVTALHQLLISRGVRFEFNRAVDVLEPGVPTVIATGAPAAARLLGEGAPELAVQVARVRVAPLATVTMFFAPHPSDTRGFGVLFPQRSGIRALGVLFNADIFDRRSQVRSETWIIGDRDRDLTALPDDRLLELIAIDRRAFCGRDVPALSAHITRWPQAVPVYDQAIVDLQAALPNMRGGLALAGNYVGRIGVAALLAIGEAAADRALRTSATKH
jgi:oxygen-dependent protoporphyrinogen oxidase